MLKTRFLHMSVSLALTFVLSVPTLAQAAAPIPVLHDDNASANFGDWYTGAVPPQASSNKPVLLFVQGLHSTYGRWVGSDSYYEAAYNAGYRTAFVQLKDSDGVGGNMWTNGPVLADVIRKVAAYYNVPKINIIAHSKGGIDTQTALVYYGASPYVNVVHQLSTPNKGSEVADLAYSSWTSWLAEMLGQRDEAVYSLQTSYMANFRTQTDGKAENNATTTYMSGGEGDDGLFTSSWFAHAILPGEDDGLVSVYSALGLPYGIKSFTKNISHSSMALASQTWGLVQPKLSLGTTRLAVSTLAVPTTEPYPSNFVEEDGNIILRGGPIDGEEAISIPLESAVERVVLEVMTSQDDTSISLVSPSGLVYSPVTASSDSDPEGIFSTAVKRVFQVNKPEPGVWLLNLTGAQDAYFAMARIDGIHKTRLKADKKVLRKGELAQVTVDFGGATRGVAKKPMISKSIKGRSSGQAKTLLDTEILNGRLRLPFEAPSEPGVYNLSFDVEGVNAKGEKLTRSINYNFAVTDAQGNIDN